MKHEIRVIGFDDSPFDKHTPGKVAVIGTFYRGGNMLDGVIFTQVDNDGDDATQVLTDAVNKSKFRHHLRAIFLGGIAIAGFNLVDIHLLNEKTGIPVIVIIRARPDPQEMKLALSKLGMQHKIKILENAGEIYDIGKIRIQVAGISLEDARQIVKICSTHSYIPEALRTAHLIGHALKKGESRGRA